MKTWEKAGYWAMNTMLWMGMLLCYYLAAFGKGPSVDTISRVMTFVCGTGLGCIAYAFTNYTLKQN